MIYYFANIQNLQATVASCTFLFRIARAKTLFQHCMESLSSLVWSVSMQESSRLLEVSFYLIWHGSTIGVSASKIKGSGMKSRSMIHFKAFVLWQFLHASAWCCAWGMTTWTLRLECDFVFQSWKSFGTESASDTVRICGAIPDTNMFKNCFVLKKARRIFLIFIVRWLVLQDRRCRF